MKRSFFIALGLYALLLALFLRLELPRSTPAKKLDVSTLRLIEPVCSCKVCSCKNCSAHTSKSLQKQQKKRNNPPKRLQKRQKPKVYKNHLPKKHLYKKRIKRKSAKKFHAKQKSRVAPQKRSAPHVASKVPVQEKSASQASSASSAPAKPAPLQKEQQKQQISSQALRNYTARIRAIVMRHRHYPRIARKLHYEGVVKLRFTITESGSVRDVRIVAPSKHAVLDRAALATLKEAAKEFPPPPRKMEIVLPLEYRLR